MPFFPDISSSFFLRSFSCSFDRISLTFLDFLLGWKKESHVQKVKMIKTFKPKHKKKAKNVRHFLIWIGSHTFNILVTAFLNKGGDENNKGSDENNKGGNENNKGGDENNKGSDENNKGSDENNDG